MSTGNIVSVNADKQVAFKTSASNLHLMYGVVASDGKIAFHGGQTEGQVAVANTGIVPVLVSDAEGDIKTGDPITVKHLAGIGEKATNAGRIIGIAMSDFTADSPDTRQTTIELNGEQRTVRIGAIDIKVGASDYTPNTTPINQAEAQNRNIIETIADNITGTITKPLGIIAASLILIAGTFVSVFLVTSSSYSSMISIGRNPLAEKRVLRSLVGLILLSVVIFCASTALAYFTLKLLG